PTGRDLGRGLAGVNRPDVLIVGGVFGVIGFIIQALIAATPVGPMTDSVALTVFLSAVIARLAYGKTGLLGDRTQPGEWLAFQRDWPQVVALGAVLGLASSYLLKIIGADKGGDVAGFGFAATGLLFLHTGTTVPVWHHIALPAAIGFTAFGGNLYAGMGAGVAGAVLGELYARLFLNHGDTHIDPPAAAIATMTVLLKLLS
ncbi:MAG: permease, partial [Bryobacterales bacterium]|nr:permease [Bryobacterales bacterium]